MHARWFQPDPIQWESYRERDFISVAMTCPVVASIRSQPHRIPYADETGRTRTYVPDFEVTLLNGRRAVIEIKMAQFINKERWKFDCAASMLAESEIDFYVLDEHMVEPRRAQQAALWHRYARADEPHSTLEKVLDVVGRHGYATVDELRLQGFGQPVIYHCLGRRLLIADAWSPLEGNSRLKFFDFLSDEHLFFDHWFNCSPWRTSVST